MGVGLTFLCGRPRRLLVSWIQGIMDPTVKAGGALLNDSRDVYRHGKRSFFLSIGFEQNRHADVYLSWNIGNPGRWRGDGSDPNRMVDPKYTDAQKGKAIRRWKGGNNWGLPPT